MAGWPASAPDYPDYLVILLALAMGTLNQVCAQEPGVTFITGTLVTLGRTLAAGDFSSALPLLLRGCVWLIAAFLGAVLDRHFPHATLLIIALWSLSLAGLHLLAQGAAHRDDAHSRH